MRQELISNPIASAQQDAPEKESGTAKARKLALAGALFAIAGGIYYFFGTSPGRPGPAAATALSAGGGDVTGSPARNTDAVTAPSSEPGQPTTPTWRGGGRAMAPDSQPDSPPESAPESDTNH